MQEHKDRIAAGPLVTEGARGRTLNQDHAMPIASKAAMGMQWPMGLTGAMGSTGPQGMTGLMGPTGAQGPTRPNGYNEWPSRQFNSAHAQESKTPVPRPEHKDVAAAAASGPISIPKSGYVAPLQAPATIYDSDVLARDALHNCPIALAVHPGPPAYDLLPAYDAPPPYEP